MNLLTGFGGFWLKLTIVAGVLYVQTILLTVC